MSGPQKRKRENKQIYKMIAYDTEVEYPAATNTAPLAAGVQVLIQEEGETST